MACLRHTLPPHEVGISAAFIIDQLRVIALVAPGACIYAILLAAKAIATRFVTLVVSFDACIVKLQRVERVGTGSWNFCGRFQRRRCSSVWRRRRHSSTHDCSAIACGVKALVVICSVSGSTFATKLPSVTRDGLRFYVRAASIVYNLQLSTRGTCSTLR